MIKMFGGSSSCSSGRGNGCSQYAGRGGKSVMVVALKEGRESEREREERAGLKLWAADKERKDMGDYWSILNEMQEFSLSLSASLSLTHTTLSLQVSGNVG